MKKQVLAVLVLMVVGLSSVFADIIATYKDKQIGALRAHQGLVYASEEVVLEDVELSSWESLGYNKEVFKIIHTTDSEVQANKDIPDYIKESVKAGFACSSYITYYHWYNEQLWAYRLRDDSIMLVLVSYRRLE